MRICIDTNVLLQLFRKQSPYSRIIDALQRGGLEFAVSNEIWLEYEETVTHLSGRARWQAINAFLQCISILHHTVFYVDPQFRFNLIAIDRDDNKFVDCAIAAGADFIIHSTTISTR